MLLVSLTPLGVTLESFSPLHWLSFSFVSLRPLWIFRSLNGQFLPMTPPQPPPQVESKSQWVGFTVGPHCMVWGLCLHHSCKCFSFEKAVTDGEESCPSSSEQGSHVISLLLSQQILSIHFLNLAIVASQSYVSFCCTKWTSSLVYPYIPCHS